MKKPEIIREINLFVPVPPGIDILNSENASQMEVVVRDVWAFDAFADALKAEASRLVAL